MSFRVHIHVQAQMVATFVGTIPKGEDTRVESADLKAVATSATSAPTVAAAIRTPTGKIYTGVCIHLSCGLGFCAEHAAAAEMIKGGETQIETIVAVADDCMMTPCGRCREFLLQVDPRNADATVILNGGRLVKLRDLMPEHWLVAPIAGG